MLSKYFSKEHKILLFLYVSTLFYVLLNEPIFSPDTYSNLLALPKRHPGYVLFINFFRQISPKHFALLAVTFQALFTLTTIHLFYKKITIYIKLSFLQKIGLIILLLFPIFPPLQIVNNLCPEGISFGLYLLFLTYGIDFLSKDKAHIKFLFMCSFILLTLFRGQFIISTIPFLLFILIKNKKAIFNKKQLTKVFILIILPFLTHGIDATYHLLKEGYFKTTPYGFVNASTLAFYTSKPEDSLLFKTEDLKSIFVNSYKRLDSLNLLHVNHTSIINDSSYLVFYNNVPKICNQTIHDKALKYHRSKSNRLKVKEIDAEAYFNAEESCKKLTLSLIKTNWKTYLNLYFKNIGNGFYSIILFSLLVIIFIFYLVKTVLCYNLNKTLIVLFLGLTISNAFLISFASHSIMRYLFYNYILIFLSLILIAKLLKHESKS